MSPRISTTAIWVAAAVVAVIAGTMAVVAVATDSPDLRSQEDIGRELDRALTQSPSPTESSTGDGTAGPPDGEPTTLSTTGGVVQASCADGKAYLHSWSPKQDYRVDEVVRGPAGVASVWLESDRFDDVLIKVRCEDGAPVAETVIDPDDHEDRDDHEDDDDD